MDSLEDLSEEDLSEEELSEEEDLSRDSAPVWCLFNGDSLLEELFNDSLDELFRASLIVSFLCFSNFFASFFFIAANLAAR